MKVRLGEGGGGGRREANRNTMHIQNMAQIQRHGEL